jgi:4-hydroxy-3-polyprenylbenzoate decarboxylase
VGKRGAQEVPVPIRDLPPFRSLRDFLDHLSAHGDLANVDEPVSLVHEITEIHRRVLHAGGPALRFNRTLNADGRLSALPVVVNMFGTVDRVAAGLGVRRERLGELGEALAALRTPQPPSGLRDALKRWPMLRAALSTRAQTVSRAPVQSVIRRAGDVDLGALPIQTCWPGEPAPLITWPLVITRPPDADPTDIARLNVGVYRLQVIGKDRLIARWLAHRGGAAHHRAWAALDREMPVAIAIGTDPATILAATLPLPETLSEMNFAGLLRGERPRVTQAISVPLPVPADAEIVIEGWASPRESAPEGPYGDHTGYYNAVENFPVVRVTAITSRTDPIYLSTYTGRPPDEPSVIGETLNELALPIIRQQMPEIIDLYLPPAACSYRVAVISIAKRYPGQARRVMMGLWGMLPQFSYTKAIVVVDEDIDVRSGSDVLWAAATRADPARDLVMLDRTPIDYLDFASPQSGLGGKLGIDATTKIGSETDREWGRPLRMSPEIVARVDAVWSRLGPALRGNGGGSGR